MGLLKLADKYSPAQLEKACEKALSYTEKPSYKSIKNLLAVMKELPESRDVKESTADAPRGITRGARYYGGNRS